MGPKILKYKTEVIKEYEQMNKNFKNKIEAVNKNIGSLLKNQKFHIDYFQREYRWQATHLRTAQ